MRVPQHHSKQIVRQDPFHRLLVNPWPYQVWHHQYGGRASSGDFPHLWNSFLSFDIIGWSEEIDDATRTHSSCICPNIYCRCHVNSVCMRGIPCLFVLKGYWEQANRWWLQTATHLGQIPPVRSHPTHVHLFHSIAVKVYQLMALGTHQCHCRVA